MTDDEMQALHDLRGCGCFRERGWDNDGSALELARECPDCLRLLADAVVRQRVERLDPRIPDHSGYVLIPPFNGESGIAMSKKALLAALTGETK